MSQLTANLAALAITESPLTPESWGDLGMWIFLAGDAMTFGSLLAGYGALRVGSIDWPVPASVLGVPLTGFMTFLLICSSVTMVKGLSVIKHDRPAAMRNFLLLTMLGGIAFLALQAFEWTHLIMAHQWLPHRSACQGENIMTQRPNLNHQEMSDDHVASLEPNYIGVFWWLFGLTIAELLVAVVPPGPTFPKLAQGMALVGMALGKASLVALYFMHLKFEKRALSIIALTPLILCVLLIFALVPDFTATPHQTVSRQAHQAAALQQ